VDDGDFGPDRWSSLELAERFGVGPCTMGTHDHAAMLVDDSTHERAAFDEVAAGTEAVRALLEEGRLDELESGHIPQRTHPAEYAEVVASFFDDVLARGT
jgi:hypothetical protein